jgi:transposase
MNARKRSQRQLSNDWALGEGCKAVNDRVWLEDRDGVRVVCVRNLPFYTYDLSDRVQHLFCACQLIEVQLAKQCEVSEVFGLSLRTLQRGRRKIRDGGIAALVPQKKGPKRRYKAGGAVGRRIVKLWNQGLGRMEIATRVGLSEGTVRNVLKEQGLYPRRQTPQSSLPFAGTNEDDSSADAPPHEVQTSASTVGIHGPGESVEATSIAYA